jgi:hypothetical protein
VIIGSFIVQPSRTDGSSSARPHTPLIRTVYCTTIPRLRFHHLSGTESHDGVVHRAITVPRAPSPEGRCYLPSARDSNPCRQALPRLYRSYWLMRQTQFLSQPRSYPCTMSLCRLLRAPAGKRVFPSVISANLSPDACTHTPVVLLVHIPVSSQETSAFITSGPTRHSTIYPYSDVRTGDFSGLQ